MIVLDTHVLVWLVAGSSRLGILARRQIDKSLKDGTLFVSAISFWEVAMLVSKGRLELGMELANWRETLLGHGLREVPLYGELAVAAGQMSALHGDPADRFIAATAHKLSARLCTADRKLLALKKTQPVLDAAR